MATRFAVKTGVWSDTTMWDSGALPVSDDVIYPNGFNVTIDTDISVASLNNNIPNIILPNMNIPAMTTNTAPSGIADSSAPTGAFQPYYVFDQIATTAWGSSNTNTGWVSYDYGTNKLIKRYYIKAITVSGYTYPVAWNFEGWNGASWVILESKTGMGATINSGYASPLLTHVTSYAKYRINITASANITLYTSFSDFQMTESSVTVLGATTGGSFTVPSSLSGTRNIVQTGEGIKTNNTTIVTIAATSGATVNFNIGSGGFILNQTSQRLIGNTTTPLINITGNCAVNFNANLWGSQTINTNYITGGTIGINAASTVTVNGNVYGSKGGSSGVNFDSVISVTNINAILNVNGDIYGGSQTYYGQTIISRAINTINVTGNIYGDLSPAIWTDTSPSINIIGTINLMGINSNAAVSSYSWSLNTVGLITVNGYVVNKNNTMAIAATKVRFTQNTNPYWVFQNSAAADITLAYGTPVTGPYPVEADVRYNTAYGASPTRYGTLRVPLPQYVSQGVLTDNTTGTAYINAADVWNVLSSSITTAGSIGERLKVASTVETTGDQLAAYIV